MFISLILWMTPWATDGRPVRRLAEDAFPESLSVVPSHRTLGVVEAEPFQLGRERPRGRTDGDDADLNPFVQGRVDLVELEPSPSVAADPSGELLALAPEPEREGTVFDRDPVRHGQATPLTQLEIEVRVRPPLDESDGPFEPEVVRRVLPDNQAGAVVGVVVRGLKPPRLEPTEHPDLGREIAPDATDDARGVHWQRGVLGAQEVGRPGDRDLQPVALGVERDLAVPGGVEHMTPGGQVSRRRVVPGKGRRGGRTKDDQGREQVTRTWKHRAPPRSGTAKSARPARHRRLEARKHLPRREHGS